MPQLPQLQVFEELLKTGDEAMRRNELGRAVELLTRQFPSASVCLRVNLPFSFCPTARVVECLGFFLSS